MHRRPSRRGSKYVSPVTSSSDESAGPSPRRRRSLWDQLSSSSESSSSSDEAELMIDGEDSEAYKDFVARPIRGRTPSVAGQPSAAKLDRLRRIFLNKPPAAKQQKTKKPTAEPRRQPASKSQRSTSSADATSSNSSGEETECVRGRAKETLTLSIDQHVAALRNQVKLLARQHNAHSQQWQATLTQAIEELTFVKQQEERALQSHVTLLQESYSLRLEVFEQQYRAKVAEIRDALRSEIALQRQKSEAAVVATAQRLQQATQQILSTNAEDVQAFSMPPQMEAAGRSAMLARTTAFLERQEAREAARRKETEATQQVSKASAMQAPTILSPVAKQRAKLRMLEQKLATFTPETVDRVVRSVETQQRERRGQPRDDRAKTEPALRPTPLSPLRTRGSHWHNGVSREDPAVDSVSSPRPLSSLSRRFLLPEEERELRSLRNSIGLATHWMEQHHVA